MNNHCYISSVSQISNQEPLSDDWLFNPTWPENEAHIKAVDPDFKMFVPSSDARRLCRFLKRGLTSSLHALQSAEITTPDAIITATSMGCMNNSELFLKDLLLYAESLSKPSLFMQSTHNTLSSLIAIKTECHGYNITYSHDAISFEQALLDGFLKVRQGHIANMLIGAHDEITLLTANILPSIHPEYNNISESSVSTVISKCDAKALCELSKVIIEKDRNLNTLLTYITDICPDVVVAGLNGNPLNDIAYNPVLASLPNHSSVCKFKHLFGDGLTASAIGYYTGVKIASTQSIPDFLKLNDTSNPSSISDIVIINHTEQYWGLIHLKALIP